MLAQHLEKIRYFVAIADFQSVSEAARATGISQAGLSKSLSLLEADLKVSLFYRNSKQMMELYSDSFCFYEANSSVDSLSGKREIRPIMVFGDALDITGRSIREHLADPVSRYKIYEAKNFEMIKTLTLQGICIGVLPKIVAKPHLLQKQLRLADLPKQRSQFGRHSIQLIAPQHFYLEYESLIKDITRLCKGWFEK